MIPIAYSRAASLKSEAKIIRGYMSETIYITSEVTAHNPYEAIYSFESGDGSYSAFPPCINDPYVYLEEFKAWSYNKDSNKDSDSWLEDYKRFMFIQNYGC